MTALDVSPLGELRIVHVDAALVVVDKPADLLSVPGRGDEKQDCVASRLRAVFADALIVHRLDMATSGLMLLARGAAVQRQMSIAFAQREVRKRYIAVVSGEVAAVEGEIDLPLRPDWPNRPLQQVDHEHGKPSVTRYRVLSRDTASNTSRLELEPLTGRTHQLRVHLLAIGHPILGDGLYAPPDVGARAGRLLLHAAAVGLQHPGDGSMVQFHSSPDF